MGLVENEGVVGIALLMGGDTTPNQAIVQDAGLIHYARGHITILDRAGLEATVCECYRVVKHESDRLLEQALAP